MGNLAKEVKQDFLNRVRSKEYSRVKGAEGGVLQEPG